MSSGPKSIQQLPLSSLLHYTRRAELDEWLGNETLNQLRGEVKRKNLKKTDVVKYIKDNDDLSAEYLESDLVQIAYARYIDAYALLQNDDVKAKRMAVNAAMRDPRKQYRGCVTANTNPANLQHCVQNYDENPQYMKVKTVPQGLRHSVYRKTGNEVLKPGKYIKDTPIPTGLKSIYRRNPQLVYMWIEQNIRKAKRLQDIKRKLEDSEDWELQSVLSEAVGDMDDSQLAESMELLDLTMRRKPKRKTSRRNEPDVRLYIPADNDTIIDEEQMMETEDPDTEEEIDAPLLVKRPRN